MKKSIGALYIFWKQLSIMLKILLGIGLLVAVALFIMGILTRAIFTYDQARDALAAYSIWHDHHLKIVGPETDIPGVFHGVVWYYLLAILYGIGRVPEFVIAIFGILSLGTIFAAGVLAHKFFRNIVITALTVILYALSPLFQVTTRWVSNPIMAFLLTPILLLLLWKFIEEQRTWLALLIGICFGLIIQGEFAFVLLLVVIPIYWIVFKWKLRLFHFIGFFVGLTLATASFFIAEIKFKGQGVKGILQFFHEGSSHHTIVQIAVFIWARILDLFGISFFPFPKVLLCVIVLAFFAYLLLQLKKEYSRQISFLLIWESILLVFLFFHVGISTSYFLFFPFLIPVIILISFALEKLYKKKYIFWSVVVLIIIFQIYQSIIFIKTNTSPLPAQQGTTLSLAKQVIAYTYQQSNGKPFTVITITNPLFINTTWEYLYMTYGLPTYGYLPYFTENQSTKTRFLIIEPPIGIPDFYIHKISLEEDLVAKVVATKHFGDYIVEKRERFSLY